MPDKLPGKIIITNTVTAEDLQFLKTAGITKVITTTPCLTGRSFGTNMLEAVLVAMQGAREPLQAEEYVQILQKLSVRYSCIDL